jgi:hypothetical protein
MLIPSTPIPEWMEDAVSDSVAERSWCIVSTGARCEKIVAGRLKAAGIEFVLPMIRVERVYCGHRCTVAVPMFPGCLFARASEREVIAACGSGRIRRVSVASDPSSLWWQLQNLELALQRGVPLESCARSSLRQRAQIASGSLQGLQGLVDSLENPSQIVFQVDGFPQAFSTAIVGSQVVAM